MLRLNIYRIQDHKYSIRKYHIVMRQTRHDQSYPLTGSTDRTNACKILVLIVVAMLSTSTERQASKDDEDADILLDGPLPSRQSIAISRDVLLFLIAFRILNALSIKTFFQPDEYFQSLEPAWQMAFGLNSGPWITWVSQISPLNASIKSIGSNLDNFGGARRSGRTIFGPLSILPFSLASTGSHLFYPEPQGCPRTVMPSFWSQLRRWRRPSSRPWGTTIPGNLGRRSTDEIAEKLGQPYVASIEL